MKKTLLYITILFVTLIIVGCTNIEDQMEEAKIFVEGEKYEEAEEIYKEIIEKEPSYEKSYMQLMEVYEKTGSIDLINKALQEGLGSVENKTPLRVALVDTYLQTFNYEKAEEMALEVLKEEKDNKKAYEKLLEVYYQQSQKEKMKETYSAYKDRIESERADLMMLREEILQGDMDNALAYLSSSPSPEEKNKDLYHTLDFLVTDVEKLVLIEAQRGDVDGDGKEENVLLLGDNNDWMYSEYIALVIQDAMTGEIMTREFIDFTGIPYYLKLTDGNNDGVLDILVSIHSGGSSDARMNKLYGYDGIGLIDYLEALGDMDVVFEDHFKVKVFSEEIDKIYQLELEPKRRELYTLEGYYDENGQALDKNSVGFHEGDLVPTYILEENKFGLKANITIKGPSYNADDIAYFEGIYIYEDGLWEIYDLYPVEEPSFEG